MSNQHTVTINGVHYDARSGLKVDAQHAKSQQAKQAETAARLARSVGGHAGGVHAKTQKAKTLNRDFVQKPHNAKRPVANSAASLDFKRTKPAVPRSPHVTKFAPSAATPTAGKSQPQAANANPATPTHAAVTRANAVASTKAHTAHAPAVHKTATETKHHAVEKALANAKSSHQAENKTAKKRRGGRVVNIASATFAVLLLAGYFTYINMPTLSVRIAASQAGIAAAYPQYKPSGYSLSGPVAFSEGQVTMNFAANSGPQKFALSQTQSTWDSSALLTNYVEVQSEGEYATHSDSGLTIYTYGNNAAWMNNGILHTVQGTAPLSNDQIRSIATSM